MIPDNSDEQEELKPRSHRKGHKRSRKKKTNISFSEAICAFERYCIDRMYWPDVRPLIDMVEAIFPRGDPPELWSAIKRIKKHFDEKIYGVKIIKEGDIIHGDKNEVNRGGKMEKFYSDDNSELFKLLEQLYKKGIWQRLTE